MIPRCLQTLAVSALAVMAVVACASSTSDELAVQALTNQTKKDTGVVKRVDSGQPAVVVVVDSAAPPAEVDAGDPVEEDAGQPVEEDSGTIPSGDAPACSAALVNQIGNIGICEFLGQLCRTVSSCSDCHGPSSGALIAECCFDGGGSKTCILKP